MLLPHFNSPVSSHAIPPTHSLTSLRWKSVEWQLHPGLLEELLPLWVGVTFELFVLLSMPEITNYKYRLLHNSFLPQENLAWQIFTQQVHFHYHFLRRCNAVQNWTFMLAWILKMSVTAWPFSISANYLPGISLALTPWCHYPDILFFSAIGCGKTTGADLLGVESEPWVFKGGVSGEVQVRCVLV